MNLSNELKTKKNFKEIIAVSSISTVEDINDTIHVIVDSRVGICPFNVNKCVNCFIAAGWNRVAIDLARENSKFNFLAYVLGSSMSALVLSNNFFFYVRNIYCDGDRPAFVSVALDLTCLIWYKESSSRKRMQDEYLLPLSRNLRNYGREFSLASYI